MKMRFVLALTMAGVLLGSCTSPIWAQQPPPGAGQGRRGDQPPPPKPGDQISPADIQSMFDAMAVLDAEKFVMLTSDQYPVFVQRLKKLQEARTMQNRRHNRALNELRGMVNPQNGKADDATVDAKLKELDGIDAETHAAVISAIQAIDQLLSPRQRARFRLLEDNIEKKKLDFLTKVRRGTV